MKVIEIKNLSKEYKMVDKEAGVFGTFKSLFAPRYKTVTAVEDISFDVDEGDILGFIGPNGAGKSTTIKMMVGILNPSSGSVMVNGLEPYKNRKENAQTMGIVFGQRTQLWWDIPVVETFSLLKDMYKIPDRKYKENLLLFDDILQINEFINKPTRQLSLGQRMRADICAALIHNPKILFLDEPTIGLDVVVKGKIREFIREINKTNKTTVILTTHDISDIEKLSNKIIVIDKGKKIYNGNLEDLKDKYGGEVSIAISAEYKEREAIIKRLKNEDVILNSEDKLIVRFNKKNYTSLDILSKIISSTDIKDFSIKETDMEEVVKKIYGYNEIEKGVV